MKNCEYKMDLRICKRSTPHILCGAYAESKRPDGLFWAHYPECNNKNCPLKHKELLEGAVLETNEI